MKIRKKTADLALAVGSAAAFAWAVKTWPGGDTIGGFVLGSIWGHPWLGAAVGALTPNRERVQTARELARTPMEWPGSASVEGTLGDWTLVAKVNRAKALKAAQQGNDVAAGEFARLAEQADARAMAQ